MRRIGLILLYMIIGISLINIVPAKICYIHFNVTRFPLQNELLMNLTTLDSNFPNECNWIGNTSSLRFWSNTTGTVASIPFAFNASSHTVWVAVPNVTIGNNQIGLFFNFTNAVGSNQSPANITIITRRTNSGNLVDPGTIEVVIFGLLS